MTATLLVALGLQTGAVKILINLDRQPDAAAPATNRVLLAKPISPISSATDAEQRPAAVNPSNRTAAATPAPAPVSESTTAASDPIPPAQTTAHSESSHSESNPEARLVSPATASATALNDPSPDSNPPTVATTVSPPAEAPIADEAATVKPTATQTTEPSSTESLQDATWIKARQPKNYTVQLYSGKDLDKLKEIAASNSFSGPQAYFTTGSRSNPWYSLVVGDHPDSASARAAAAAISAQSTQIKPWVRRFDDIQTNLR